MSDRLPKKKGIRGDKMDPPHDALGLRNTLSALMLNDVGTRTEAGALLLRFCTHALFCRGLKCNEEVLYKLAATLSGLRCSFWADMRQTDAGLHPGISLRFRHLRVRRGCSWSDSMGSRANWRKFCFPAVAQRRAPMDSATAGVDGRGESICVTHHPTRAGVQTEARRRGPRGGENPRLILPQPAPEAVEAESRAAGCRPRCVGYRTTRADSDRAGCRR